MYQRLIAPALLALLCACASPEPRHARGEQADDADGGTAVHRPRVRLFISPSGEPFRGPDGLGDWLAQADTDHDGAVSLAEFRADALRSFKVLDANGDGVIDAFELQAYERNIVPEIGVMTFDEGPNSPNQPANRRRSGGGGGGGGMGRGGAPHDDPSQMLAEQANKPPKGAGREGAARYSLLNEPEPIAAADADLDGKVTLAEWMAQTDRRFAKLDHMKTGQLTRQSLVQIQPKDQKAPPPKAP
jgi:hypothetical protein